MNPDVWTLNGREPRIFCPECGHMIEDHDQDGCCDTWVVEDWSDGVSLCHCDAKVSDIAYQVAANLRAGRAS